MPRSVATAHTLDFLGFYLPKTPARLLEVGCGAGHVAKALLDLGHEVVAIDASPRAVAAANSIGVRAIQADFSKFEGPGEFDAVLFTSSLHHMANLDATLSKAKRLLKPKGVCLIEDFAWERPDGATLAWECGVKRLLASAPTDDVFPSSSDLIAQWQSDHQHEPPLHFGVQMLEAARAVFENVDQGEAPYLYRSAIPLLEGKPGAIEIVKTLVQWESLAIEQGSILPVGYRIICSRAPELPA